MPRVAFVTRKFPPSVGGMETLAAGVWRTLHAAQSDSVLIAHGGHNRALPRWLPWAVVRTAWLVVSRRVDVVLAGDAIVYTVLDPLLRRTRAQHVAMIMGKDVTWEPRLYRAVVHRSLRRASRVIAISEATAAGARGFGVPADRIEVVRLGVDAPAVSTGDRTAARRELGHRHGLDPDAVVLLTLGRLVRRKGVRWFVEQVLPGLPENVVYLVAGDGDELAAVRRAAATTGTADRVLLLGRVDDAHREQLMRGADVFVQPNIPVPGDMEGFGLVVVEAALRGTPVVAAALEGILDAVDDGRTGLLVAPGDADAWTAAVGGLARDPAALIELGQRFQSATRERYNEAAMGRRLLALLPGPAAPTG